MSAIEYGSYYWCVVLNGKEQDSAGESVHLHADEVAIDGAGCLVFKSAGRRPAGAEPKQQKDNTDNGDDRDSSNDGNDEKDSKEGKEGDDEKSDKKGNMIYVAFGPGTWRVFFAAKLQDGTPASIEHWSGTNANRVSPSIVPPNSGAVGYIPKN
jgi:hypothetical protein